MNHDEEIEELTDPDPEVRQDAYEEVTLEMDDDLAHAIVEIAAGDLSDAIRADAIVSLGPLIEECGMDYDETLGFEWAPELGPPVSRQTFQFVVKRIRAIYEDETAPKLLRRRAFEVLVRDPQPWQSDEIRKHLASPDEDWRLTAIFGMGAVKGFEKELLDVVTNGEGIQLTEAVRSAGQMSVAGAAGPIRRLATSSKTERDLRLEAIAALPLVDAEAFEILDELSRSKDREIAEAAQEALHELLLDAGLDDDDIEEE
jgi:hypothetical protein